VAEAEADGVADAAPTMLAAPDPPAPASPATIRTASTPLPWITATAPHWPATATTARRPAADLVPASLRPLHPLIPSLCPRLREDSTSRIFAFVNDLFFAAKIQETARKLNVKVEFAKNDKDLAERMLQNGEESRRSLSSTSTTPTPNRSP